MLKCVILNYGLQRNMEEQKDFIRDFFFPTFLFVPDSAAHAWHVILKYVTGLRKDLRNNS